MLRKSLAPFAALLLVLPLTARPALAEYRLLSGDADNLPKAASTALLDISPDGKLVLFAAAPPSQGTAAGISVGGLYRRNLVDGTLAFVGDNTTANPSIAEASMSNDGRYVAWAASGDVSGYSHVYWRDSQAGTTVFVTTGANGRSRRPILSGDGRYVVFISDARNLIADTNKLPLSGRGALYRYDSQTGTIAAVSLSSTGAGLATGISNGGLNVGAWMDFDYSNDGSYVVFTSDSNNVTPQSSTGTWVYRRNLGSGAVDIVNRDSSNTIANAGYSRPSISTNGNRIAFLGSFIGVFGSSISDQIAATFGSEAMTKDMTSGDVWWVTRTTDGKPLSTNGTVTRVALSGDGQVVAMTAAATLLVADDVFPDAGTDDSFDIYRVALGSNRATTTTHISRPFDGAAVNIGLSGDGAPSLPADGAYVAYAAADADVALGFTAASTQVAQQVVGVGTFPDPVSAVACGDANGDGHIKAADALIALKTAVGSGSCKLTVCDYNGDAKVSASDALVILKVAVGSVIAAKCPVQ